MLKETGKKLAGKAVRQLKKSIMSTEQNDRTKHADTVIRNHVVWSMGAGLIPVLVADIFAVSALQLDMIRQLCRVYDLDFSETQGKAIVTSLTSSTLARVGAGSLIKLIPGIGSLLGGVTVSIFAGASTYALGEVFKKHFASGGTILDFDPGRLRKMYKEKFEKGKKVVTEWKQEMEAEEKEAEKGGSVEEVVQTAAPKPKEANPSPTMSQDVIEQLSKLAELKAAGVISEEEFQQMKQKLIDSF